MNQVIEQRGNRRELEGVVIRTSMQKTLIAQVLRTVQHPTFKKYIRLKKKYYVHDEKKAAQVGDTIRIVESRPLSKLKKWRLKEVLRKTS